MSIRLLEGDCRETLPLLEAASVQCAITSPPYYSVRDYGTEPLVWGDWTGSLGAEPTLEVYVEHLVEIFRGVWRVLRDDGVLWLNLGDKYVTEPVPGFKAKDLLLVPFRAAMALQQDGWWLRAAIPWLKRNPTPDSARDRPTTVIEYAFLLTKSEHYYWNAEVVRVPNSREYARAGGQWAIHGADDLTGQRRGGTSQNGLADHAAHPAGRLRRSTDWFFESWQGLLLDEDDDPLALVVNSRSFRGAHYATFPPKLIEPMLKATSRPGDTVLDPFAGSGTVGLVADRLAREVVLCELQPQYTNIAGERLTGDAPLFVQLQGF